MSEIPTDEKVDVAFSFAGAQRNYVEKTKNELSKYKVSVFYDNDNVVDLWGKNLYQYLYEIYSEKARYCVIFISKEYKERPWTMHEFHSASERVLDNYGKQDMQEYILPVIFDDTKIPGLLMSIGHVDARETTPEKLAEYIALKVGKYNVNNDAVQSVNSLFEYIRSRLDNYADKNADVLVSKENSIISIFCNSPNRSRNVITFQLFEKYINLYLGEFLLGINPTAIIFIDSNCMSPSIKLIDFSIFFKRVPEQNLSLEEFDNFLNDMILTLLEEII